MSYIYDLTDTWNAGGTTFNAIKMNVTDSASAVTSKLVSLQTNGTEHFSVTKAGVGYVSNSLQAGSGTAQATIGAKSLLFYNTSVSEGFVQSADDTSTFNSMGISKDVLRFLTQNTERMRILGSGNVGIGTSSPTQKLEINGNVAISGVGSTLTFDTTGSPQANIISTVDSFNIRMTCGRGSTSSFTAGSGAATIETGGSERMRIDGSGNVGIGTSLPSAKLDVVNAGNFSARIRNSNATAGLYSELLLETANTFNNASQVSIRGVSTNGGNSDIALTFGTSSGSVGTATERMRIDASGNVGIGTASPGYKLQVNGTMAGVVASGANYSAIRTSDFYYMTVSADGLNTLTDANGSAPMLFKTGGTERARIDASGNLLVGTTSNTYGSRCVFASNGGSNIMETRQTGTGNQYHAIFINANGAVGSITTDGSATQFTTSSDVRLKHDIVDAPEASSLIDAIQVRSFKWNADNTEQRYGFVAQELVTVAPEAVSQPENPDDMMGVDYSKLVPMLVKEIQSLRARVAQLEGN